MLWNYEQYLGVPAIFMRGSVFMNPVIGLDISKGKSDGQVFIDKGKPFGNPFCIQHNQDGLKQLLDVIANESWMPCFVLNQLSTAMTTL